MNRRRVFFYVQHLLGIGHQRRAATVARAMQEAGLDVTFVSGGHGIPGLDIGGAQLVQLPPVRAVDVYFKQLVDEQDRPIDDDWRARRAALLLEAFRAAAPHVLLFELFPFGRRQMRFEIMPLLETAASSSPRPLILSSVRDILVAQDKPGRNDEMVALVERYFDHVLVHGDPGLIPFDRTFPHAARIRDRLSYTGYVVDASGRRGGPGDDGWDEVLVSAGGGAVGHHLLREAIRARPLTRVRDKRWRVLVGLKAPETEFAELRALAAPGVTVERARGDFTSLLMNCALSVSQAGYNTIMEAMRAGCPCVVAPYAGGLETEQTLRAQLLAARGALEVVPEQEVSAARIAAAVDAALERPRAAARLRVDGAPESARLVAAWAAGG